MQLCGNELKVVCAMEKSLLWMCMGSTFPRRTAATIDCYWQNQCDGCSHGRLAGGVARARRTIALEQNRRKQMSLLRTAVLLILCVASPCYAAEDRAYATGTDGERPEQLVVIEDVRAWPNLTEFSDGTIIARSSTSPAMG